MIATDSALDGSGGLSGWLALPADCLPVASQAVRGALLGYVAHSRVCCTGRTTPTGDDELAMAPRAEDQHELTSPKDLPEICGRRLTGGRTGHRHGFQGIITKRQGLATHAETPFLECWGLGDHWQDVRPLKTAVQGLQLADGDYRPTPQCVALFMYRAWQRVW